MASDHNNELPQHVVLMAPWTYEVTSYSWRRGLDTQLNDALEMTLVKSGEVVRLRFDGVAEFEVETGFPSRGSAFQILDASSRGMEVASVRVTGIGQDPTIRFWARSVRRVAA
jgi:hypothetical protein